MSLGAALMRALYLRTLHRHVGPCLITRTPIPDNSNCREIPTATGRGSPPIAAPHPVSFAFHGACNA